MNLYGIISLENQNSGVNTMELNINSPVYYKDHYGIDNEVYRFTQRAQLFFKEKEYSNTLQIIGFVPIIAPQEVYAAGNYKERVKF